MADRPIQPVIQLVTIDTMLNSSGLNIGDGLNFVTHEQTLRVVGPFIMGTPIFLNMAWVAMQTRVLCPPEQCLARPSLAL